MISEEKYTHVQSAIHICTFHNYRLSQSHIENHCTCSECTEFFLASFLKQYNIATIYIIFVIISKLQVIWEGVHSLYVNIVLFIQGTTTFRDFGIHRVSGRS
jgi:hypothetical protein